jgi:hypothetical protein
MTSQPPSDAVVSNVFADRDDDPCAAELSRVEMLSLSTLPSWDASGRVTEVRSLAPIAKMNSLKHVALFGIVSRSRSLMALEDCPNLVVARFSKYPKAEVERFREASGIVRDDFPATAG